MSKQQFQRLATCACLVFGCGKSLVQADGLIVDKVYDPYVNPLESEIEYRLLHDDESNTQYHRLGIGHALSDRVSAEVYLLSTDTGHGNADLEAYEAEVKWQLTEQGELDNDWGLLFELEKSNHIDAWELSSTAIAVHEMQDWIATVNFSLLYEWGDAVSDELETQLASQLRYRLSSRLEPALELYSGQDAVGLGPVLVGSERLGRRNRLNWQAGIIAGLTHESPDTILQLSLEYEFY